VDTGLLGLRDLRRGLAVIPQDPTLFKGSARMNLDMFSEYDDDQMWDALRWVGQEDRGPDPGNLNLLRDCRAAMVFSLLMFLCHTKAVAMVTAAAGFHVVC
jgi:ABC-type transport system involved in cytochrome bd biosynthesis fused ATPase/permease subunit